MTARGLGVMTALAVLVADQAAKAAVLSYFWTNGPASSPLAPFLDLALRWNRGISFSFFSQDTAGGRFALLVVTLAATGLLAWWLSRSRSSLVAIGLGAIIGGALGNAFDRAMRGAVVDYLDFHVAGTHFFVFNLADAAINIGVALLVIDLAFGSRTRDDPNPTPIPPGFK